MNNQIERDIQYVVGKLVAKYPFVKAYMDIVNKTYLVNFEVDETQLEDNHPYYTDRFDSLKLLPYYDNVVWFTTNEHLFKLTERKVEIKPFVVDKDLSMKDKIKMIIRFINDICDRYGVDDVCLEDIYHPISYNSDGSPVIMSHCKVNHKKNIFSGNNIIEIHYRYYDEGWRGTLLSESDTSYNAQRSADRIIDALHLAAIKYHKQHKLFMQVKNQIGDNTHNRLIFEQLFQNNF